MEEVLIKLEEIRTEMRNSNELLRYELKKEIREANQELLNRVDKLELNIIELSNRVDKLELNISELSNRVDKLELNISELSNRVDKLELNISELSNRVDKLELNISELSNRVDKLELNISELSNRLDKVEITIEGVIVEQIRILKDEIVMRIDIDNIQNTEIDRMQGEIDENKLQNWNNESRIKALESLK